MSRRKKKESDHADIDELFPVETEPFFELAAQVLSGLLTDIRSEQEALGLYTVRGKNLQPQFVRINGFLAEVHELIKNNKYRQKSGITKDAVRTFLRIFLEKYREKLGKEDAAKMRQKLQELWLIIRDEK